MSVFTNNTSSSGIQTSRAASPRRTYTEIIAGVEKSPKGPKGLIFITEVIDLRNTATNKHCLQGRTCDDKSPAFDYVELTFQAAVAGGTLSASCASLACGYENQALRAVKTIGGKLQ
jgi:hypothetical protein